jgi:protein-arginine kinase
MPSNTKNNQWRQDAKIAIKRAERIAKGLQELMFVIYDNEEERYDIVNENEFAHLTEQFDIDYDFIAEVS